MKKYVINGKLLLNNNITGIERYTIEIIKQLDKMTDSSKVDITILIPKCNDSIPYKFENIKVYKYGPYVNLLWGQVFFPLYAFKNKALCVSFNNGAPIIKPDIVTIHDIKSITHPHYTNKKFNLWSLFLFHFIFKKAKKIIAVSEFTKNEIIRGYNYDSDNIKVIYSSWQQFKHIKENDDILFKHNLEKGNYYFSLGSLSESKNTKWIIEVAKRNNDKVFVLSGKPLELVGKTQFKENEFSHIKYLGRLSDSGVKSLMKNCKAFLFPSLYEGFGIPPLEAMSVGAKVIVSDIEVMHEIYGDSAYYVNPYDYNVDLDKLLEEPVADSQEVLNKYSWEKSAKKLLEILDSIE